MVMLMELPEREIPSHRRHRQLRRWQATARSSSAASATAASTTTLSKGNARGGYQHRFRKQDALSIRSY